LAWLVVAVALALRVAHVWQIRSSPFFDVLLGDARGYDAWAQRLAGGDWLGDGVFYQAPLHPRFLGTLDAIAWRDLLLIRRKPSPIGPRRTTAWASRSRSWAAQTRRPRTSLGPSHSIPR
jgi:hypothetical protein